MKFLLISIGCLCLAVSDASSQNQDSVAIRKYYEENTIYWSGWTAYYKNNQAFPLRNLKNEDFRSRDAIYEFNKYRHNRTGLVISGTIGAGLLISSFFVKDRRIKQGLALGSVAAFTISIPFSLRLSRHLNKAIWLHNRDVLIK